MTEATYYLYYTKKLIQENDLTVCICLINKIIKGKRSQIQIRQSMNYFNSKTDI